MQASVVIVGGGVVGAATAYFLAQEHGIRATVIERDPAYTLASSARSASGIRQQFSAEVNIRLSLASLAFLRRAESELAIGDERPALPLTEAGYLTLASSAAGAEALRSMQALQQDCGADIVLLDRAALTQRFPWLRVDDLELAAWGRSGEGWTDGWALLMALRRKAIACGAVFVEAEATELCRRGNRVTGVRDRDGRVFGADEVLLCAGAWSADLLAPLDIELPVRPSRRDVFVFDSPAAAPGCPLVVDPCGLWFRPEGRGFIGGAPPRQGDGRMGDPSALDPIDHGQFVEQLWPALAHRVPGFEALRNTGAWAGFYDMNLFDHNALIGAWPGLAGLRMACGFSGHGLQQAPAAAQALAAMLVGAPAWVDVTTLSPARILAEAPLWEQQVI